MLRKVEGRALARPFFSLASDLLLGFLRGLLVFRFFRLRLARRTLRWRIIFRAFAAAAGAGFRVVGHIPAGAFELHGRCGEQLLHRSAALRTLLHLRIRELLDLFKGVFALLALIFVKGHGRVNSSRSLYIDCSKVKCGDRR